MTSILVVCTGNICRSPIAEGFLRDAFVARFGDGVLAVSSAGIAGLEGSPASEGSVISAAEHGSDITDHHARMLTHDMLDTDLVVGMASEHRDAVVEMAPEVAGRAFTLKELVRLLGAMEPVAPAGGPDSLADRVASAESLRRSGFPRNHQDESVVDPIGLPLSAYRAVASELDEWTRRLDIGLYGAQDARIADEDDRTRGAVG
jgi:protein-tyrosine phosphatase